MLPYKTFLDLVATNPSSIQMLADKYLEGEIPPYFIVKHILLNKEVLDISTKTSVFRSLHASGQVIKQPMTLDQGLEATRAMVAAGMVPWEAVAANYEQLIAELEEAYKTCVAIATMSQYHLEQQGPDMMRITIPKESIRDEMVKLRKEIIGIFNRDIKNKLQNIEVQPDAIKAFLESNVKNMEAVYMDLMAGLKEKAESELGWYEVERTKATILYMLNIARRFNPARLDGRLFFFLWREMFEELVRVGFDRSKVPPEFGTTKEKLFDALRYGERGTKRLLGKDLKSVLAHGSFVKMNQYGLIYLHIEAI